MGNFQGSENGAGQRRYGALRRVVLVVEPPPLLLRMAEVARGFDTLQVVGSFSRAAEALDWLVWDRPRWDLAYVDLAMKTGASEEVVARLMASGQRGTVVGIADHLWRETRLAWTPRGVPDLLEKGDMLAFQGDLARRGRA